MYQINAVFNRAILEEVLTGLEEEEIYGVTVTNVLGKGCLGGRENELSEKVLIKVVVAGVPHKERAMEAIRANAQDTEHVAGKMWVMPVLEVERIRTGEKNEDALWHTDEEKNNSSIDIDTFTAVDTPAS
jgi:nitrogen regulatory protein P-II 1